MTTVIPADFTIANGTTLITDIRVYAESIQQVEAFNHWSIEDILGVLAIPVAAKATFNVTLETVDACAFVNTTIHDARRYRAEAKRRDQIVRDCVLTVIDSYGDDVRSFFQSKVHKYDVAPHHVRVWAEHANMTITVNAIDAMLAEDAAAARAIDDEIKDKRAMRAAIKTQRESGEITKEEWEAQDNTLRDEIADLKASL